jgi:hypothetical protein
MYKAQYLIWTARPNLTTKDNKIFWQHLVTYSTLYRFLLRSNTLIGVSSLNTVNFIQLLFFSIYTICVLLQMMRLLVIPFQFYIRQLCIAYNYEILIFPLWPVKLTTNPNT